MANRAIITENGMEYLVSYKDGKEKTRFCLEVDPAKWVPVHPGDICPEYMLRYCRAQGVADLEWYVNILGEVITKTSKKTKKGSDEVLSTNAISRKRTPSEVKQEFIQKYFPTMKRVREEEYVGHAAKAKKALEELKALQPSQVAPKKSGPRE